MEIDLDKDYAFASGRWAREDGEPDALAAWFWWKSIHVDELSDDLKSSFLQGWNEA